MNALAILTAHTEIDLTNPHLDQLTGLTPVEWLAILDAMIDRTIPDHIRERIEQIIQPHILVQRWHERQLASVELRPALLPWFIRGTL